MFFRWPWDGAATLLGPSGRPLATSPAVQGAARDYGGGGAQTAAQGRKGCRRAERAGNQHHARLARYMDRAARWLQHTAPATTPGRSRRSGLRWRRPGGRRHVARRATGSGTRRWGVAPREAAASPHGGAERNRPPAPPPPFRSTRPPASAHGGNGNGGPALRTRRRAESSRLLRWFQHAAAETGTASSGARGSHRQPVHGERQKAARWRGDRTAPPLHTAATATAAATAPGPPAPAHGNSGRARRAAAQSTRQQQRRARTAGQQKQRAWKDSLDRSSPNK